MDAVTYPDSGVISFINKNFIPLRIQNDAEPFATDFGVKWTPTLVTLDFDGREHQRTVGFLAPEDLISSLLLGSAKVYYDSDKLGEALEKLGKLVSDYSRSDDAPEAIFLRGVSGFKSSHDPKKLKAAYEKLRADYPGSAWTKRAYPYRLI